MFCINAKKITIGKNSSRRCNFTGAGMQTVRSHQSLLMALLEFYNNSNYYRRFIYFDYSTIHNTLFALLLNSAVSEHMVHLLLQRQHHCKHRPFTFFTLHFDGALVLLYYLLRDIQA